MLVAPLIEGPLDIVGDVHGEFEALQALLQRLGYDQRGEHPQGRRLIFVGDLCDRGPDSARTLRVVAHLVKNELAQMTLGNHELNTLRADRKHGSEWFFDADGNPKTDEHRDIVDFLVAQPLALERADLRVTHAAWHAPSIETLRTDNRDAKSAFEAGDENAQREAEEAGLAQAARAEKQSWGKMLLDDTAPTPLLRGLGGLDEFIQMGNPLRVVSSGVEQLARRPFFASGKWRFVDRVPWWRDYADETPVVFGHYWRWWNPGSHALLSKGEPSLFEGVEPADWLPTLGRANAMCIDYSVGARYKERQRGATGEFRGRLAALRWPERELVFDSAQP